MPLERVTQKYKDVSMSFKSNPLNDDLIGLKNESAIARSIRNIVFTLPERNFLIQILVLTYLNHYLRILMKFLQ